MNKGLIASAVSPGLVVGPSSTANGGKEAQHPKKQNYFYPSSRRLPPGPGLDALGSRRALFERSELVRTPKARVRPILSGRAGRQWFWVLLPKQKGLGRRNETRQHQ